MKLHIRIFVVNSRMKVEKKKARGRALKLHIRIFVVNSRMKVEKKKARGRALKHVNYFVYTVVYLVE